MVRGQDSEQGSARLRPASALSLLGSDLVRAPVDEDVLLEPRQHALGPAAAPSGLLSLSRKTPSLAFFLPFHRPPPLAWPGWRSARTMRAKTRLNKERASRALSGKAQDLLLKCPAQRPGVCTRA